MGTKTVSMEAAFIDAVEKRGNQRMLALCGEEKTGMRMVELIASLAKTPTASGETLPQEKADRLLTTIFLEGINDDVARAAAKAWNTVRPPDAARGITAEELGSIQCLFSHPDSSKLINDVRELALRYDEKSGAVAVTNIAVLLYDRAMKELRFIARRCPNPDVAALAKNKSDERFNGRRMTD